MLAVMASSPNEIFTKPLAASQIGKILTELVGKLPLAPNQALTITIKPSMPSLAVAVELAAEQRLDWDSLIAAQADVLKGLPYIAVNSWSIVGAGMHVVYMLEDSAVGKVIITGASGTPNVEKPLLLETLRVLDSVLDLQMRPLLVSESLPAVHRDQLRYQQQILTELQGTASEITTKIADLTVSTQKALLDQQVEWERSFRRREEELDANYRRRQSDLDAVAKAAEEESVSRLVAREEAVVKREEETRKLREEIDLRNATAARRSNQVRIQQIIEAQSKVKLTDETTQKRYIIHVLCAFGTASFGVMAGVFLYNIVVENRGGVQWEFAIPFSTGLLGFASTLIYWIKWSDSWFREHARAEFSNRKFNADATRANWLVEVLLEWSKEGRDTMPPAVLESLTKNLFSEVSSEAPSHSSDPLQRFLGRLANIRVTAEGVELDSASKTIKKL